MFCPHCKDVPLAMTDRQGIEIDYCPTCRGIWLDRGELDRLIERAEREATPPPPVAARVPASRPGDAGYYGDGGERGHYREGGEGGERGHATHPGGYTTHRPRKKKSLLGELFDF
jgi:Zn-finger nucleic acid-binding protein